MGYLSIPLMMAVQRLKKIMRRGFEERKKLFHYWKKQMFSDNNSQGMEYNDYSNYEPKHKING